MGFVVSVEPSLMTISSSSLNDPDSIDCIASVIVFSALYAGRMTLMSGVEGME